MNIKNTYIIIQASTRGEKEKNRDGEIKRGLNKTRKLERAQREILDQFAIVIKQDEREQRANKRKLTRMAKRKQSTIHIHG